MDSGNTYTFVYNALGQRVESHYGTNPSYNWLEYVYGAAGHVVGIHYRVAWMNRSFWLGNRRLYVQQGGGTRYLHPSPLGSGDWVTNQDGTVAEKEGYYPWGGNWVTAGPGAYDNRFAGMQPRDGYTGLDATQFRMYESRLGRWLSPDPLGGDIANPQSLNRYAYVLNNPATLTDPLGSHPVSCTDMDCADQYYGGSMYSGFSSADQTTVCQDGVCVNANSQAANFITMSLQSGSVAECPTDMWGNDVCSYVNSNGQFMQYHAFAGAAGAANGYYAAWGVGSLAYTRNQAGISASKWGTWYLQHTGSEVGGSLWCGFGVCSSTLQQAGPPGEMYFYLTTDFSDIPSSVQGQGWWRAQTGEYSPGSDYGWMLGTSHTLYTGTPSGRVLMVGPTTGGSECVLVGPTLPGDTIAGCGP